MTNEDQVNEDKNIGSAIVDRETEQGFTPGPWEVKESKVPGYERNVDVIAGNLRVAEVTGGGVLNPEVLAQVRANARLIAAAPTMYEALRSVADRLNAATQWKTNDGQSIPMPTLIEMRHAENAARAALALVDKPANESAKRPISDHGNDGQASQTDSE